MGNVSNESSPAVLAPAKKSALYTAFVWRHADALMDFIKTKDSVSPRKWSVILAHSTRCVRSEWFALLRSAAPASARTVTSSREDSVVEVSNTSWFKFWMANVLGNHNSYFNELLHKCSRESCGSIPYCLIYPFCSDFFSCHRNSTGRKMSRTRRMRSECGVLQSKRRTLPVPSRVLQRRQNLSAAQESVSAVLISKRVCPECQLHGRLWCKRLHVQHWFLWQQWTLREKYQARKALHRTGTVRSPCRVHFWSGRRVPVWQRVDVSHIFQYMHHYKCRYIDQTISN